MMKPMGPLRSTNRPAMGAASISGTAKSTNVAPTQAIEAPRATR